ncbi:2340_t:CDS:2 [Gigaspora margarita]|uniref:2340_t:CDS:1 n=1 Tax=Gigaspora margarita TaxID=4874 RepID=A0ABM8W6W6_GIGMA|nr:2340_t:CDS:2 [Gigaspora margarita]
MANPSKIGYLSGVSLLVAAMTGPGLVTVPLLFQTSGWITSLTILILVSLISSFSSLLLCEAIGSLPGNEKFTVCNLISKLETCGISISPDSGWLCTEELGDESSPFGNRWMLLTAGFMTTLLFVIPMTWMRLSNNAKIQIVSFTIIIFVIFAWAAALILHGVDPSRIPIIGENQSQSVGIVLFNYAFITAVPSLANELEEDGSIRKIVWTATSISTFGYITLGILGAMAFDLDLSTNIVTSIRKSELQGLIPVKHFRAFFPEGTKEWFSIWVAWACIIVGCSLVILIIISIALKGN